MPVWRRRRSSSGGASTCDGQRLDAGGQRRILARHLDVAPVHGGFLGGRRFEIVAERGAERRLVALLHAQAIDDGREIGVPRADQQLDQRLALGAQRSQPQPRLAAFLARRIGRGDDRAGGLLGGQRLHLELGDLVGELLAGLGDLRQLFRVGRAPGDLARLRIQLGELAA